MTPTMPTRRSRTTTLSALLARPLLAALSCILLSPAAILAWGQADLPAPEGEAVVEYVTTTKPYAKWTLMPGTARMRVGREPHNGLQNVYVNKVALRAIQKQKAAMPDGAMVVKEVRSPADKKLVAVNVMYKKTGYNPGGGDWMWLAFGPDKAIQAQGKVEACITCHGTAKDSDWLMLAPLHPATGQAADTATSQNRQGRKGR